MINNKNNNKTVNCGSHFPVLCYRKSKIHALVLFINFNCDFFMMNLRFVNL